MSIIGFLLILGPLVVVHEFGHFLFAKLFRVRADVFSVGFGPRIFGRQIGETEFRISAVPLGGYVKLFGEDMEQELAPEERKRALYAQEPWKRFLIFFGGPLFNFLFACLIFMVIFVLGEPRVAGVAGRVVQGSYAEQVGFRTGDRILAIDSKPVSTFNDVILSINEVGDSEVSVQVRHRTGVEETLRLTPMLQEGYSQYGEEKQVGHLPGLYASSRVTEVGIANQSSLAAKAGVKTGDTVASVNGKAVPTWEALEFAYADAAPGSELDFAFVRSGGDKYSAKLRKPENSKTLGFDLGLRSSELFVDSVVDGSPAQVAGVQKGDRMVKVGTVEVPSFFDLKDEIQNASSKNGKVRITWERNGKLTEAILTPTENKHSSPTLKQSTEFTIGVVPMLKTAEAEMVVERVFNPFMLVYMSVMRTADISWRNLVSLGKMVTGDVSIKTLGGPILIGKIAGDSLARGLIHFLSMMAVLSVGLGVLNILPIPVLDGGHLLLLSIETVRGKALTIRQMEIVQQVGLSLILLIMVIVMRNDLARLALFD